MLSLWLPLILIALLLGVSSWIVSLAHEYGYLLSPIAAKVFAAAAIPPPAAWVLSILLIALVLRASWSVLRRMRSLPLEHQVAISLAGVAVLLFVQGTAETAPNRILIGSLVGLCSAGLFSMPQPQRARKVDDHLFRSFFSSRLANYLCMDCMEQPPLGRIAILAQWGEGKTRLLELIERDLLSRANESATPFYAKTVWINPWKATTKEEAWEIVTSAFDLIRHPVHRFWTQSGPTWTRFLSALLPEKSLGRQVLDALESQFPQKAEDVIKKVDQEIKDRGLRLFVFVDDMERADPQAVRGILPVIDRLSEMKNCFFIFGIDRERLEDAFIHLNQPAPPAPVAPRVQTEPPEDETQRSGSQDRSRRSSEYVTGYLDKVMNIQLDLPGCEPHEIIDWISKRIEQHRNICPKLYRAFPVIKNHLPRNPRVADKFFKLAIQTELLFLKDYAADEKNYEALFFLLLGEVRFPGFRRYLESHAEWEGLADSEFGMAMMWMGSARAEGLERFADNMKRDLQIPAAGDKAAALQGIFMEVARRVGPVIALDSEIPESAQWLTSGFMVRRLLSRQDMDAVERNWIRSGGTGRFRGIINQICQREKKVPSNTGEAVHQVLMRILNKQEQSSKTIHSKRFVGEITNADLQEVVAALTAFRNYFSRGRKWLEDTDLVALRVRGDDPNRTNPTIIAAFEDLIRALPIEANENGPLGDFRRLRMETMRIVTAALDPQDISDVSARLRSTYRDDSISDTAAVRTELADVGVNVLPRLAELFCENLAVKPWYSFSDPAQTRRDHPYVILNPEPWVPRQGDQYDVTFLDRLADAGSSNTIVADNLFEIVRGLFLSPLIRPEGAETLDFELRRLISADNNRPYVAAFWRAALRCNDGERNRRMFEMRERIAELAGREESQEASQPDFPLSIEGIEECFPLPSEPATEADAEP